MIRDGDPNMRPSPARPADFSQPSGSGTSAQAPGHHRSTSYDFDGMISSAASSRLSPMHLSSVGSEALDLPVTDSEDDATRDPSTGRPTITSRALWTSLWPTGRPEDLGGLAPHELDSDFLRLFPNMQAAILRRRQPQNQDGPPADDSSDQLLQDSLTLYRGYQLLERRFRHEMERRRELESANTKLKDIYAKSCAKAEQEEEYIANQLLKRIEKLKSDKEALAQKYEQEEEFLANEMMRRISQLQAERDATAAAAAAAAAAHAAATTSSTAVPAAGNMIVAHSPSSTNSSMPSPGAYSPAAVETPTVAQLVATVRRMEAEMATARKNIERLRREKCDQENQLEQEQELLFNTLGKRIEQLNGDKRRMQRAIRQAYQAGHRSRAGSTSSSHATSQNFTDEESERLRGELRATQLVVRIQENQLSEQRQVLEERDSELRRVRQQADRLADQRNAIVKIMEEAQEGVVNRLNATLGLLGGGIVSGSGASSPAGSRQSPCTIRPQRPASHSAASTGEPMN